MNLHTANQQVKNWFLEEPTLAAIAAHLLESYPSANSILIVGGALRDFFLTPRRKPKDIDVVLDGVTQRQLCNVGPVSRNFFGGVTLTIQGVAVDMWLLEDTYHLKHFPLPCNVQGLLDGAPFNLDKIAYDLRTTCLYDSSCLDGVARQQIAYAPAWPYLEHIQAARSVLLRWKTGFALDESVLEMLQRTAKLLDKNPQAVLDIEAYLRLAPSNHNDLPNRVIAEIYRLAKRPTTRAAQKRSVTNV